MIPFDGKIETSYNGFQPQSIKLVNHLDNYGLFQKRTEEYLKFERTLKNIVLFLF
jgi:hypothetical protein